MKHTRLLTLTVASFCLIILASFKMLPGNSKEHNYTDKNLVFKVSYDASTEKLVALEKLEISSNYIQRSEEGKIVNVDKTAILNDMPMATKIQTQAMIGGNTAEMYALVTFHVADKMGGAPPSEDRMLEFLRISYDSYSKHNFSGSDYSVSGKNFTCGGPSCGYNVPAGIEVYVWQ